MSDLSSCGDIFHVGSTSCAQRRYSPRNSRSRDIEDHLSHTTVALESLVAIYALGAYIVKRRRFEYFRPLLAKEVRPSGVDLDRQAKNCPMIMWPMLAIWGEPEALKYRAGRIDICTSKIMHDATILDFFGDEDSARKALIELEFLVEFNSFLVVETAFSPATAKYMQSQYPKTDFSFWPSLFAFDLQFIMGIAGQLFALFDSGTNPALSEILYDPEEAKIHTIWQGNLYMVLADAPRRTREADVGAKPLFGIYLLASVYPRRPKVYSTSMIRRTDRSSANW